jgi:hypothetical protein
MTDTDNACSTLQQRTAFLQMMIPPVRFNGVANPYLNTNYTTSQLDMRRKAEILQYNKNSSQTNKLTKAQRFTKAIGRTATTICANDLYIPSLSSSSDVPGPVITLQYDPTVPLYNYVQNTASLGLINTEDTSKWVDSTKDDIVSYDSTETVLLDLAINKIETSSTTFSINSPIGIYVDGTAASAIVGDVNLNSIEVSVYYNDVNYLLTSPIAPVINTLTDLKSKTARFTVTNTSPPISKKFSGVIYIGNLNITNLTLPTMNGYVYKIKVKFKLTSSNTGTYSSFNTGVYMNVSTTATNSPVNCTFSSPDPTSVSPREPFSISGV